MQKWIKLLFSRLVLTGLLIILQAFIIFFLLIKLSDYFVAIHIVFVVFSIILVLYILNKNDEPSFKLPWLVLILLFPVFGGLFYLMFGDNKMRKKVKKMAKKLSPSILSSHADTLPQKEENREKLWQEDKQICLQSDYITHATKMPLYQHTTSEYLEIGEVFFKRLIEEIKKAKHFIFLEFFILQEGKMLNTVVDILEAKVKEGVDVRFLYDDLGSIYVLPSNYHKKLERLGIKCEIFNPFVPVLSIGHNNRDHRKIIVIDGYVGLTGGFNLADEYINEYEKHGHWKDTGMLIKGEAVKNLTLMFLESWNYYRNEDTDLSKFMPHVYHSDDFPSDGFVQPYGDTPLDDEKVGETVYLNIINTATDYVYINTPYLIINYTILNALVMAAKKGIDIRIMTPHIPDKWYVHIVTQSYYLSLIKAGVKIYEYTPGFIHAKTFVSDDKVGVVGTINLDYRSLCHHFECGIWLYHTTSILKIKEDYLKTIEKSMPITEEFCNQIPWIKKIITEVVKFFAPLM